MTVTEGGFNKHFSTKVNRSRKKNSSFPYPSPLVRTLFSHFTKERFPHTNLQTSTSPAIVQVNNTAEVFLILFYSYFISKPSGNPIFTIFKLHPEPITSHYWYTQVHYYLSPVLFQHLPHLALVHLPLSFLDTIAKGIVFKT